MPNISDVNMFVNTTNKGTLLYDRDVIQQSILNILTTPLGSRYRLPTYGSNLPSLLQENISDETIYAAKAYTIQALQRWEPRIILIEEEIRFFQSQPDGISGIVPYNIPEFSISDTFSATFIRD